MENTGFYRSLMEEMMDSIRVEILGEGLNDTVLFHLHEKWEGKLVDAGILRGSGTEDAPTPEEASAAKRRLEENEDSPPAKRAKTREVEGEGEPEAAELAEATKEGDRSNTDEESAHERGGAPSAGVGDSHALQPGNVASSGQTSGSAGVGESAAAEQSLSVGSTENPSRRDDGEGNGQYDGAEDSAGDDEDDLLGSDLDDSENESDEGDDNILVTQYEKVSRVRNVWKCTFRSAILTLENKEYVFKRLQSEMKW